MSGAVGCCERSRSYARALRPSLFSQNEKRKSDKDSRPNLRIEGMYIDVIEMKESNLLEISNVQQVAGLPIVVPCLGSPCSECPVRCKGPPAQVRTQCSIGVLAAECTYGARREAHWHGLTAEPKVTARMRVFTNASRMPFVSA
jgi:hypothetical protein